MVIRRQRRWNVTLAFLLVAVLLVLVTAFNRLEVQQVRSRDGLRPTVASHRVLQSQGLESTGPGGLRGIRLQGEEAAADKAGLQSAPFKLEVGVYPVNNYAVNLLDPSYQSTGYIWYRWDQALQDYLERNQLDAGHVFVPVNAIGGSSADALRPLQKEPIRLADSRYYALYSYSGKFYIDNLDFHRFPFSGIGLPLAIEADNAFLDYRMLRLVPDLRGSAVGGYADISGWVNRGWSFAEYRHQYATNFGLDAGESSYSQAVFEVAYGSSAWAAFWKLLQPLMVVMVMVVLSSKLPGHLDDVRLGVPVTVLLTLVFLQQSYQSSMPTLPYLTFLDKVYVVCFAITLFTFLLSLWVARRRHQMEHLGDPVLMAAVEARIEVLDNISPPAVLIVMAMAVSLCWLL